jgi:hypothetical protein
MDITYNLIIKTLSNNHLKVNDEFIKKMESVQTLDEFPTKFKHLLKKNMYRKSVINYDNDNTNISFWSSLVLLLQLPYKISTIIEFKNKITLEKRCLSNETTDDIQSVANLLDVNFIIFDFQTVNIFLVYKEIQMNPLKQTFLFAKYKDLWSVIITDNKYLFDINTIEIKNILNSNCKYYNQNKSINIDYDIINIINSEKEKYFDKINSDIFIKAETIQEEKTNIIPKTTNSLDITKISSMKICELTELCTTLNISFKKKNTKKELIELITNNSKENNSKENNSKENNSKENNSKENNSKENNSKENNSKENNSKENNSNELNNNTKDKLIEICEKLKLKYKKSAKKSELIQIIVESKL